MSWMANTNNRLDEYLSAAAVSDGSNGFGDSEWRASIYAGRRNGLNITCENRNKAFTGLPSGYR